MFYLKGKKMVELTTMFATLSLFLAWRLYVVSRNLNMADTMIRGILAGKVVITQNKDTIELEIKDNG
jgi:hypothetical protein